MDRAIITFQYADDTLLNLVDGGIIGHQINQSSCNLKLILTYFEEIFGIRINYHKSELILVGVGDEDVVPFLENFQCVACSFPIKYLGVPLHYNKLTRADLQPILDKIFSGNAS